MNQKTSPEVSNQEVQKAEQEEKTSGKWSRRSFLQAGSVGLSALAVSACTGNLDVLKKKLVLTQEIPDFTQYITTGLAAYANGNPTFDPSKPITVIVDTLVKLTGNLTIPETMELVIRRHRGPKSNSQITTSTYPAPNTPPNRIGNIFLNGYKLVIRGTFRASPFKVFEYKNPMHIFGESEGVRFGKDAVARVDASWFGAEGVANTDVSTALDSTYPIQRAIDSALQRLEGPIREWGPGHVFLHRGKYKLTDTLHILRYEANPSTTVYNFPSFVFEGSGMGYQETQLYLLDKTEQIKRTDRPLINIQVTRHTIIRNLQLIGQNTRPTQEYATRRPELSHWVSEPGWVSRYRPYCAIAIDGYMGVKNGTGSIPGYIDTPSAYYPMDSTRKIQYWPAGGGSQKTFIERVSIHNFGVGIAIAPGGTAQNDGHVIKECEIKNCALGISIGTSQARAVHVKSTDIYRAHTAITSVHNGSTTGGSLINLSSNQYLGCRSIYRLSPYYHGSSSIHGDYAEDTLRLGTFGHIGTATKTSAISFSGCNYRLETIQDIGTLGSLSIGNTALHFQGCTFQMGENNEFSLQMAVPQYDRITFETCVFNFDNALQATSYVSPIRLFPGVQAIQWHLAESAVRFENCTIPRNAAKGGAFPISDELPVFLYGTVTPIRYPLHWNTNSIRVGGGIYGEKTLDLRNTIQTVGYASSLPYIPIGHPSAHPTDPCKILFQPHPHHPASLEKYRAGDRFFIKMKYKGDDVHVAGAGMVEAPVITLDDEGNGQLVWESGKVRASINSTVPSYRNDFELVPSASQDGYLYLYPRVDLGNANNSQRYVILNGVVKGQFTLNSQVVSVAENADLLQVGDFVNQDYVPHGTRIKSIDLTSTPPTITMTAKATKTSQGAAHIPAIYVQGS